MIRGIVILIIAALMPTGAWAQAGKLLPVDEALTVPSFVSFRAQFLTAIARRDTAFLYASIDPNIRTSFGDGGGLVAFKRAWSPEKPGSQVWETLACILALGGKRVGDDRFAAPYVYAAWPERFDSFEYAAIVGENVLVRDAPETGRPIASLTFDIVRVTALPPARSGLPQRDGWATVELRNGTKGYVSGKYIYSPVGYRAIFALKNGRWVLEALVAGD